jgi:molybdopterin-containing oxidoreductase family iron-sulfur binding subunit
MKDFTGGRRAVGSRKAMNRLYAVESSPTLVGAMADNRLVARASEVEMIAGALAAAVGVPVKGVPSLSPERQKWVAAVAADLKKQAGSGIVIAGRWQSPMVHALAHAMNARLSGGRTVSYAEPVAVRTDSQTDSLRALIGDMQAGQVESLIIFGGNPVYATPADFAFGAALKKVGFTAYHTLYNDETADLCQWVLPDTHYLEQWGDVRGYDGTITIQQPLIAPLYSGKSVHEFAGALIGDGGKSGYDIIRDAWKKRATGDFEKFWRKVLNDGVVAGTGSAAKHAALKPEGGWAVVSAAPAPKSGTLEAMFRPDPTIWDGRFSNNGWLQEFPKPLTKIAWDNAAQISPATAQELGLANMDVITIDNQGHRINAPVWVQPGHPDGAVTLTLGYGRWRAGRLGNGTGYSAYAVRTTNGLWSAPGVTVKKLGRSYFLAQTQTQDNMASREPVRQKTLAKFVEDPHWDEEPAPRTAAEADVGTAGGIYAPAAEADYKWGMAINLNACTGCGACVIACQSENNIPIVGKVEVKRGRAMHWLRIDRYFEGAPANPHTHFQPVPCMHCETAPCEVVCPVGATIHDNEGLNNMVYNRCVGTKYCSNNCPYKVRHFNFYEYSDTDTPVLKLMRNPEVTVRSRGVMEKCSYCVQRISHARIDAKNESRKIRDGEVKTACQTACPAEAITFGDISDPNSLVSKLKADPLNYGLLAAELNTKPRTTYLGKVTNPNESLGEGSST